VVLVPFVVLVEYRCSIGLNHLIVGFNRRFQPSVSIVGFNRRLRIVGFDCQQLWASIVQLLALRFGSSALAVGIALAIAASSCACPLYFGVCVEGCL
jgi:hypothetical protein